MCIPPSPSHSLVNWQSTPADRRSAGLEKPGFQSQGTFLDRCYLEAFPVRHVDKYAASLPSGGPTSSWAACRAPHLVSQDRVSALTVFPVAHGAALQGSQCTGNIFLSLISHQKRRFLPREI